jgi:hypothetical protein
MPINNVIVISDTHFGCQLAVCKKMRLDAAGHYTPSRLQKVLLTWWGKFWNDWVPKATRGEDFILVHNGDIIDGIHHKATTQISHNINDQKNLALEMLEPIVALSSCKGYYQIRGTEAHAGQTQEFEENIAKQLGAIPNENGQYSRYDLWLKFGRGKLLTHFSHHIGTTSSASYESTAVYKELIEAYVEAGRWRLEPPDCVIRSHRHRFSKIEISSSNDNAISVVTPAWQLKTPFVWKLGMGRSSTPQIGGILIRSGSEVNIYCRQKVWTVDRSKEVKA